jgi:hypothetical protein
MPVLMGAAAVSGFLVWPTTPAPAPAPSRSPAAGAVVFGSSIVLVAPTRASSAAQQTSAEKELKVCRGDAASSEEAPSLEGEQQQLAATNARRKHLLEALSTGALPETRALGAWLAQLHAEGEAYSPYFDRIQLCKQDSSA